MIIDFHTHTFPAKIAGKVLGKLQKMSRSMPYTDGTDAGLQTSMKKACIDYSVTLPVMTNVEQVEKLNSLAIASLEQMSDTGLIPFGGMHPEYKNYKEELKRLKDAGIKGFKIHPAYQGVDFDDPRFMQIMDTASELGLIILTHAGLDIGIPHHNYTSVEQILHVMKDVQPEKLVLAHMGGWDNWKQVKSDLAGAPLWMDTAFTLGLIEPAPGTERAPEESMMMEDTEFIDLCRVHGTERILFATDCPWSDQKTYVDRFLKMDLTDTEQTAIMGKNAQELLGMN